MFMDDIKLFAKKEKKRKKEIETLIQTIWIYSQDIGMEFDFEYAILLMKSRKRERTQGTEPKSIGTLREKENYKKLWILEAEMEEKFRKV